MSILRRGRSIAVLGFLVAGGVGIISSTQTWLTVIRTDAAEPLAVIGADAVPLLAPLSLAVLAVGAALAISGIVLRHVLAVLAAGAAVVLIAGTVPLLTDPPQSAVSASVTEATGIAGTDAIAAMVDRIDPAGWPGIALACWALLLAASVFALVSARRWKRGGRRYQSASAAHEHGAGRLDPVDSWDELSHGTDPTD